MFKEWKFNDWMNNGLFFATALMLIYSFIFLFKNVKLLFYEWNLHFCSCLFLCLGINSNKYLEWSKLFVDTLHRANDIEISIWWTDIFWNASSCFVIALFQHLLSSLSPCQQLFHFAKTIAAAVSLLITTLCKVWT